MNFKPIFGLIAGAFLALNLNASTIKKGELTVATEGTYSPYSFYDEKGELVGYDVDIARAVAQKLNLKVEFLTAPWDAMLAAFDAGKADVVFNQVSINEDRKKKYGMSVPYTMPYPVIVVHKDNNDIKSFADLKGKKSVHSATSNWAAIAEKNGATVVVADGFSKGVELIISKRADDTINDNVTFYDYIKQRPNAPLKIAYTSNEPMPTAAIIKKGNTELLEAINKALDELKAEGKISEISMKYFGKDISK
ncbi:amino acid ABC transporter substrate-binding protein [Campylobacter concisus]|uniref:amino acid ABC transporter substrate-binding protein n=1 Tax=Campylobacter concisus TaxID=199 RepID=UPI0011E84857|nr:amino acid ABC transporter substrate-binding protein [Campylobacter concisus]